MGLFKFLLGQPSREYSDNVKGKLAEDAWSDIDHRKINTNTTCKWRKSKSNGR